MPQTIWWPIVNTHRRTLAMSWKSTRRFFPVSHIYLRVSKGTSGLLFRCQTKRERRRWSGSPQSLCLMAGKWELLPAGWIERLKSCDDHDTKKQNLNHWNFFSATKSSSSLRTGNILRAGDLLSSLPSTTGQSVGVLLVKTIVSNRWQFQHQK